MSVLISCQLQNTLMMMITMIICLSSDLMPYTQLYMMALGWLKFLEDTSSSLTPLPCLSLEGMSIGLTGGPTHWLKPTNGPEPMWPWSKKPAPNPSTWRYTIPAGSHKVRNHLAVFQNCLEGLWTDDDVKDPKEHNERSL